MIAPTISIVTTGLGWAPALSKRSVLRSASVPIHVVTIKTEYIISIIFAVFLNSYLNNLPNI